MGTTPNGSISLSIVPFKITSELFAILESSLPTIDINVDLFTGAKSFTAFTMDFTKNYIEINADYRS